MGLLRTSNENYLPLCVLSSETFCCFLITSIFNALHFIYDKFVCAGGSISDTARNAEINIRSNSFCRGVFGSNYDTSHICAGGSGTSVCNVSTDTQIVNRILR